MANDARRSYEEYWNRTCPEKKFEHALCSERWDVELSDVIKFFSVRAGDALGENAAVEGSDKIGCLETWVEKRLLDLGKRGEFVWELEQGFRKG